MEYSLKDLRELKVLSQTEVSLYLGISSGAISLLERGKRPLNVDEAILLAKIYGTSLEGICNAYTNSKTKNCKNKKK